jgi:hypothetical protein
MRASLKGRTSGKRAQGGDPEPVCTPGDPFARGPQSSWRPIPHLDAVMASSLTYRQFLLREPIMAQSARSVRTFHGVSSTSLPFAGVLLFGIPVIYLTTTIRCDNMTVTLGGGVRAVKDPGNILFPPAALPAKCEHGQGVVRSVPSINRLDIL